ncbi:hypothetical protein Pint_11677 [Pistacia integerrima]|uniref:Uncharacterized protein n=1 Tax=Pistacia integerrima TaxID=434235 RepID=A0ACC0XGH5_9ROSI|nr:hypothetical protein Pint_11677 [Pistacia integerrima]
MSSRAILQRKSYLFNSLNRRTSLIRGFSSFENGQSIASNDFRQSSWVGISSHSSEDTDHGHEGGLSSVTKDEISKYLAREFLRHNSLPVSNLGYRVGRVNFVSPLGSTWMSQSVRYSSTATAGQRENDGNEQRTAKQVKEASPEECDQAVEGLSTAKAKAKAKQMLDSQKSAKSIVQRVWAMLLGIGPALRAVASMSRPRLVNMCKYMGVSPYGTDAYLRYMLRKRLQEFCFIFFANNSEEKLHVSWLLIQYFSLQLRDWLDLSLNHSVPSSLLILSRAFSVSGKVKPEEAVQATLSSLPDEVVDTVGVTALPSEDSVSERRRKLEFLEMQEELIKEEEEEEEEEQAKLKESVSSQKDVALEEMTDPTAKEAREQARAKTLEKHEQLCELSRALAVLASASSVSREREEFLRLVNKEIGLYNSMVEKEGKEGEEEAKKAYRAAREDPEQDAEEEVGDKVSSALIDRVDAMLQKVEKEIDDVDAKIGDRWRVLDRDFDGKVTPEEVASAAMYLKDTLDKEGIQELISNLSKDREGKILVKDIVKLGGETEDADSDTAEAGRS